MVRSRLRAIVTAISSFDGNWVLNPFGESSRTISLKSWLRKFENFSSEENLLAWRGPVR